jgi:hypothetical protein
MLSSPFSSPLQRCLPALILAVTLSSSLAGSGTEWQGDALANLWSDSANWTAGVPNSSTNVILPDVPSGQLQITDSHASALTIAVAATSSAFTISSESPYALELYGDFANESLATVSIAADVLLKNSLTLAGTVGLLDFFGSMDAALTQNLLSGTVAFGGTLVLALESTASYGNFTLLSEASLDLTGLTTLAFSPSAYTGVLNDTFQLFDVSAGSWSGVSELAIATDSLPVLTEGLSWNCTNFETDGSISVVPEPGSLGLFLSACAALGICLWRRGRRAPIPAHPRQSMLLKIRHVVALLAAALVLNACQTVDPDAPARLAMNAAIRAETPGDYFIGRRMYKADYKMWGWVREPGRPWTSARLVMLNEQGKLAPDREAGKLGTDNNYEYRLTGTFSGETVYEPASDRFYPEFVLTGYEVINKTPPGIYIVKRQEDPAVRIIMAPVY